VPSGHLITARLASRPDLVVMKPGQKAKVGWARRDVRLIEGKTE
jgi:hypothetical protein